MPNAKKVALKGRKVKWDQFEANERLFGVTTTFVSDDIYSTDLDRNSEWYRKNGIEAQKV
eukprot:CAMPEP_0118942318 /NCGR_PEP_ID=MMETSP1169-20130426/35967_1 /TAXON_ID=36882 /ORGANISM="Pyramimonas obovata, Strain CCMP722" /LENGTH=59 /DNA_ID=CAMNT_0006887323 /DNA_START=43 /DNA_END=219 /DNA_ORIENTATION=+